MKLRDLALTLALMLTALMCSNVSAAEEHSIALSKTINSVAEAMALSKESMPEIRYELGKQPMKAYEGGRSNEATALNFPHI